jgi:hypothetical protein
MGEFRSLCAKEKMNELGWPQREYVIQIARFDPAKGEELLWLQRFLVLSYLLRHPQCHRFLCQVPTPSKDPCAGSYRGRPPTVVDLWTWRR